MNVPPLLRLSSEREQTSLSEEHRHTESDEGILEQIWKSELGLYWAMSSGWRWLYCTKEVPAELVSISVLCFQSWAGRILWLCSMYRHKWFPGICIPLQLESCQGLHIGQFKSRRIRGNGPQRANSLLDHQHHFTELLLACAALWTLSRCTWAAFLGSI